VRGGRGVKSGGVNGGRGGVQSHKESRCHPHGFCRRHQCVCAAAFQGADCKDAKPLPFGIGAGSDGVGAGDDEDDDVSSSFEGDSILSSTHVLARGGINFTANPKVWSRRYCLPRLRIPLNATHEGPRCVWLMW